MLIGASLLASILAYPTLPEQVASHWNAAGEVDGYMPRLASVLLLPGLIALFFGLIMLLPVFDPLRSNIARFRPQYNLVAVALSGFLAYLHLLTLAWNLGWQIPIGGALAPAAGIFFFGIGAAMKSAKPNWTFGIRTPWTLSSPVVWDRTHSVGSTAFKIAGVLVTFGTFFPEFAIPLLLIVLGFTAVGLILYSFLLYRKLNKDGS